MVPSAQVMVLITPPGSSSYIYFKNLKLPILKLKCLSVKIELVPSSQLVWLLKKLNS